MNIVSFWRVILKESKISPQGDESGEEVERGRWRSRKSARTSLHRQHNTKNSWHMNVVRIWQEVKENCFPLISISGRCRGWHLLEPARCAAIEKKKFEIVQKPTRASQGSAKPKKCAKWQSQCYDLRERRKGPQQQDTESSWNTFGSRWSKWSSKWILDKGPS